MSSCSHNAVLALVLLLSLAELQFNQPSEVCEHPLKTWIFVRYLEPPFLRLTVFLLKYEASARVQKIGSLVACVLLPSSTLWTFYGVYLFNAIDQTEPECFGEQASMLTVFCIAVSFFFVVMYSLQAVLTMMGDPVQHLEFGNSAIREPLLDADQAEACRAIISNSRILPP